MKNTFLRDKISFLCNRLTDNWLLLLLIVVCFLIHLYSALKYGTLTADGTQYASLGKNLIKLGKYQSDGSHFPDIIQPPLYPIFISILYIFTKNSYLSAISVASIFRGLCILPLFLLGKTLFTNRTAILTSILFIFYPLLFNFAIKINSETTYCFFFLTAVYLLFLFSKKVSSKMAIIIGIIIGCSYSIRIEGYLLIITFVFFLLLEKSKTFPMVSIFKYFFCCIVGFSIIYLPLSFFIHSQTGKWIFCPKARLILIHQGIWRTSDSDPAFHSSSKTMKYERAIFKYSPEKLDLQANVLFFGKAGTHAESTESKNYFDHDSTLSGNLRKIRQFFIFRILTYFKNLFSVYKHLTTHLFMPPLLLPIFILGILANPWSKDLWDVNIRFFVILFVSSAFLFSHFSLRFFFTVIPITLFWAANGILHISQWTSQSLNSINFNIREKVVRSFLLVILILSFIPSYILVAKSNSQKMSHYKRVADLITSHVPQNTFVIARKPQSSYLANRKYATLPYLNFDELILYSQQFSQSALVFPDKDHLIRPELGKQLKELAEVHITDPRFEIIQERGCTIVLFQQA